MHLSKWVLAIFWLWNYIPPEAVPNCFRPLCLINASTNTLRGWNDFKHFTIDVLQMQSGESTGHISIGICCAYDWKIKFRYCKTESPREIGYPEKSIIFFNESPSKHIHKLLCVKNAKGHRSTQPLIGLDGQSEFLNSQYLYNFLSLLVIAS